MTPVFPRFDSKSSARPDLIGTRAGLPMPRKTLASEESVWKPGASTCSAHLQVSMCLNLQCPPEGGLYKSARKLGCHTGSEDAGYDKRQLKSATAITRGDGAGLFRLHFSGQISELVS